MTFYIAADAGGTQLRAACYSHDNLKPLKLARIPTYNADSGDSPLERLENLVASVWPKGEQVAAICVTAPGPVNPYSGVVLKAPNIPEWVDLPLRDLFQERFKTPVLLGNDANLAALGEWMFGAGKGHHHLVYVTISTGIGGGVIVDDQLLLGVHGLAAELGHITVLPDGPLCGCGHRGHLESIASGPSIARWVQDEISQGTPSRLISEKPITAMKVSETAQKGDALCIAALARAGYYLGSALADFLHIFNPSVVIIGGGVSRSGPLLLEPMRQSLQEHILAPGYLEGLVITTAAFGDEAGLVGALALGHMTIP